MYNYKTGQLICAITTPTYDPDNVPQFMEGDERYNGLYVNRFVQSCYTPGSIFKIVTLAAALETNPEIADTTDVVEKFGDSFNPKKENWPGIKGDVDMNFSYLNY